MQMHNRASSRSRGMNDNIQESQQSASMQVHEHQMMATANPRRVRSAWHVGAHGEGRTWVCSRLRQPQDEAQDVEMRSGAHPRKQRGYYSPGHQDAPQKPGRTHPAQRGISIRLLQCCGNVLPSCP